MRLKNHFTLLAFIFTVCFLLAGNGYSARLSEGNEIGSSPQKTKNSEQPPENKKGTQTGAEKENSRFVQMDMRDMDISHLISVISELTGKNFIVDSNVKGKVTIISPTRVSVEEAYKTFESVLEVNNLTTVPAGNSIKILPIKEAIKKDIDTQFGDTRENPEDRLITRIVPLKYASPKDLQGTLKNFSSGITPYDPTGVLIITDVQSNIIRLLEIIEALDVPGTGEEITVIPLKQASAKTIASMLKTIFKATASGVPGKKTSQTAQMTIEPDERTNSLIVVASEVDTLAIRELIDMLDINTKVKETYMYMIFRMPMLKNCRKHLWLFPRTPVSQDSRALQYLCFQRIFRLLRTRLPTH